MKQKNYDFLIPKGTPTLINGTQMHLPGDLCCEFSEKVLKRLNNNLIGLDKTIEVSYDNKIIKVDLRSLLLEQ